MSRRPLDAAIVGIGQTEFSKDSGRSELQLAAEASLAALADAGLGVSDVDGMVTFSVDPTEDVELMRVLGVPSLGYSVRLPHGGGGSAATVYHAAAALTTGAARFVLVYRALNARSGRRFGQARDAASTPSVGAGWSFAQWYAPYGALTPAATLSMHALAFMQTHGLSNEDFGEYVVGIRDFASTNPEAWFHGRPITLAEHQASRWIIEPVLRLLDCCQETDGGVAFVVSTLERARALRHEPAVVLGAAQGVGGNDIAGRVYAQAGVGPADLDAAMIYDAFSVDVFGSLEDLALCPRGQVKDFVASGSIRRGGSLPVNTNGGLIGEGYLHGMNLLTEAVRQVRGTAANQVADARHVLVSSGRGACILGGDA